MVRLWRIVRGGAASMEASLKDHRGAVNALALAASGAEAVSGSADGSCILWDLGPTPRKRAAMYASSFFTAAAFHPDDSQVVTGATDRKVCSALDRPAGWQPP
jgi:hypothetical protein